MMTDNPPIRAETRGDYTYSTLTEDDIRILVLHPGQDNDELRGTLETVSQLEYPRYKAISYVWGEPVFSQELFFPNGVLKITQSLHEIFHHFRSGNEDVRLWADQVCINQHDAREKAMQVAMMDSIYCKAEETLIWLGLEHPDDCRVLRMLHFLDEHRVGNTDQYGNYRDDTISQLPEAFQRNMTKVSSCGQCLSGRTCNISTLDEGHNILGVFWDRPWYSRLWTLQESLLVDLQRYIFGRHETAQSVIAHAAFLHHAYITKGTGIVKANPFQRKGAYRASIMFRDTAKVTRILRLLLFNFLRQCSEPRDRVFAVRSLANVNHVEELEPDYVAPISTIWRRTAKYLLLDASKFESVDRNDFSPSPALVLAISGLQATPKNAALPSWVPDFSQLDANAARRYEEYVRVRKMFAAGGRSKFKPTINPVDQNLIQVRAQFISNIEDIEPYSYYQPWEEETQEEYWDIVETIRVPWYLDCRTFLLEAMAMHHLSLGDLDRKLILQQGFERDFAAHEQLSPSFEECLPHFRKALQAEDPPVSENEIDIQRMYNDLEALLVYNSGGGNLDPTKVLAVTLDGRICWVSRSACVGDSVWLVKGAPFPFVLRVREDASYEIIGDAYVHGVMSGELWSVDERDSNMIDIR